MNIQEIIPFLYKYNKMTTKLDLSKKGFGFMLYAGLGILLAAILLIVFTRVDVVFKPLGTDQYDVLYANEQVESAKTYIDLSTKYAADLAVDELFNKGGLFYEVSDSGRSQAPCGNYIYTLYSSPQHNCTPQFSTAYKEFFKSLVGEYFLAYKPFQLQVYYAVSLTQQSKTRVHVQAQANKKVQVPLRSNYEVINYAKQAIGAKYPKGLLGGYMNESIVNCTTGYCFAEVANYYYELYDSQGGLAYVWGGVSPYSYEDTVYAKQNKANSFFKGTVIHKVQPGKHILTMPGFDCSGFVWWAAKHAGIQDLSVRRTAEQFYRQAKKKGKLICGENKNDCFINVILNQAQAGDILFYAPVKGVNMTHIMIYLGNGKIVHSRGSRGLVREYLPTSYVSDVSTKIQAVYRFSYPTKGIANLSELTGGKVPASGSYVSPAPIHGSYNYLSFTPFMNTTTELDLNALNYISEPRNSQTFVSFLHTCTNDIQSCVTTQVSKFNALNKPSSQEKNRVQITRNGEDDALAYSLVEQLLDCYYNEQTNCICPITINSSLKTRFDEFAMEFKSDGDVYAGEEHLSGVASSSKKFVTHLPFNPTITYYDKRPAQQTSQAGSTSSQTNIAIPSTGALSSDERNALVIEQSKKLGIDPRMAFAIFQVEAGKNAFCSNGKPLIRFEPHIFGQKYPQAPWAVPYPKTGTAAEKAAANQQMRTNWEKTHNHGSTCSTNDREWTAFEEAKLLNPRAAYDSISSGLAQIMGFNHNMLGYSSAQDQLDAFKNSEKAQIEGFFSFVQHRVGLITAIQNHDFSKIANLYNAESLNCEQQSQQPQSCYSAKIRYAYSSQGGVPLSQSTPPTQKNRDYVEVFVDKTAQGKTRLEIEQTLRDKVWDIPQDTQQLALLKTSATNLSWIKFTSDYNPYICRDNKKYFRFIANFTFTDKKLAFALFLNDSIPPAKLQPTLVQQNCAKFDAVLFSWDVLKTEEPIYSFDLYISNKTSSFPSRPTESILMNSVQQAPNTPQEISVAGQLYVDHLSTVDRYYYLLSGYYSKNSLGQTSFVPLQLQDTYTYALLARDHYNNSQTLSSAQFVPSQLPFAQGLPHPCISPALTPPLTPQSFP